MYIFNIIVIIYIYIYMYIYIYIYIYDIYYIVYINYDTLVQIWK